MEVFVKDVCHIVLQPEIADTRKKIGSSDLAGRFWKVEVAIHSLEFVYQLRTIGHALFPGSESYKSAN